jgi:hypothetical protein
MSRLILQQETATGAASQKRLVAPARLFDPNAG